MADQYGIDVGNILSNVENIRGARVRNALAENELDRIQRGQRERENALSGVNAPTAGLAVVDPSGAIQIENYLSSLSEQERKERQDAAEITGRMAVNVLQSEDPEVAYQQVRAQMPAEIQSEMPPTYDQEWVETKLAEATMISDILSGGGQQQEVTPRTDLGKLRADLDAGLITQEQYDAEVAARSESTAFDPNADAPSGYQWTDETRTSLAPITGGPKDPASGGEGGIPVGVANAIRSTVVQQFGGTYDPQTGEFAFGDPSQAGRALDIMARAEAFAAEGMPPATAVQRAFEAVGGQVQTVTPQEGTDDSGVIDFTDFFGVPE